MNKEYKYTVIMNDKNKDGVREQFSYDKLSLIWYVHGSSMHTELAWRGFRKEKGKVIAETIPYCQIYKIVCNDDCSEIFDMMVDVLDEEVELMKSFMQYANIRKKEIKKVINDEQNKIKSDVSVR